MERTIEEQNFFDKQIEKEMNDDRIYQEEQQKKQQEMANRRMKKAKIKCSEFLKLLEKYDPEKAKNTSLGNRINSEVTNCYYHANECNYCNEKLKEAREEYIQYLRKKR